MYFINRSHEKKEILSSMCIYIASFFMFLQA